MGTWRGDSDAELLCRFVEDREGAAFNELIRRHRPAVLTTILRVIPDATAAEDVLQSVFLIFSAQAAQIRRAESVGAWLAHVAANSARKARRATGIRRLREAEAAVVERLPSPSELEGEEVGLILEEEVDSLPQEIREPIVLCYLDGETHEHAAEKLGVPVGSISKLLARGKDLLRQRLLERGVTLSAVGALGLSSGEAAASVGAVAWIKALLQQGAGVLVAGKVKTSAIVLAGAVVATGVLYPPPDEALPALPPEQVETLSVRTELPSAPAKVSDPSVEIPEPPRPVPTDRVLEPVVAPVRPALRGERPRRPTPSGPRGERPASMPPRKVAAGLPQLPRQAFGRHAAVKGAILRSADPRRGKESSGASQGIRGSAAASGPEASAAGQAVALEASRQASAASAKGHATAQAAFEAASTAAQRAARGGGSRK